MASSYGFTKFFAATLCLVGFCKITFKLDSYMASLGVNLGRPAPGMGAAGAMLAASRIISQAARTASGSGGTGDVGGTRTDMGSSDGMTTNFTGPIPMTPMDDTSTKARNIRAVLLTALYNSVNTINSYYGNRYHFHLAEETRREMEETD